jgi:hypothetical protein
MPGCYARCSLDLTVPLFQTNGSAQTTVALPNAPGNLGFTFHAQVLAQDPGINPFGAVVSNGITLTVGN